MEPWCIGSALKEIATAASMWFYPLSFAEHINGIRNYAHLYEKAILRL